MLNNLIFEDNVKSMDNARNVTQNCQTDVDQKISTTSSFKEDTDRRQDDRKDDLADVTA